MRTIIIFFIAILSYNCGHHKSNQQVEKSKISPSDQIDKQEDTSAPLIMNTAVPKNIIDTMTFFQDLDSALMNAKKVNHLIIEPRYNPATKISKYYDLQNLPREIGQLENLRILEIHCLEKLDELPIEIGQLIRLERIIINNGNGCVMNIKIPNSIGKLQNLKELTLYGAIDARYFIRMDSIDKTKNPLSIVKALPIELSNLRNLEVLDLGRNGIQSIPKEVEFLVNLRILKLDYNDIHEIPEFISKLKNLKELHICENGKVKLPDSLSEFENLELFLGNACLSLKDQEMLKSKYPKIKFNFENDYMDGIANEEKQQ